MTRRASSGMSFETPDRWSDRSMFIVVAAGDASGERGASIVVTREERAGGLEAHARRMLEGAAAAGGRVEVVTYGPVDVASCPAFRVQHRVLVEGGVAIEVITVFVDLRDPKLVTIVTASGPVGGTWHFDLERLLASVRVDASTYAAEARTLRTPLPPAPRWPVPTPPDGFPIASAAPWIPMPGERSRRPGER